MSLLGAGVALASLEDVTAGAMGSGIGVEGGVDATLGDGVSIVEEASELEDFVSRRAAGFGVLALATFCGRAFAGAGASCGFEVLSVSVAVGCGAGAVATAGVSGALVFSLFVVAFVDCVVVALAWIGFLPTVWSSTTAPMITPAAIVPIATPMWSTESSYCFPWVDLGPDRREVVARFKRESDCAYTEGCVILRAVARGVASPR